MEPDIWDPHMTTSSTQHGPSDYEMEVKCHVSPKLNFELHRTVYHSEMDREQVKSENQCSSLVTIPGLGVVNDAYFNSLATMEWRQAYKHMKPFYGGQTRSISQSAFYGALWESQASHVNHIGFSCGSTVGIGSANESDTQGHKYPSITFTGTPVPENRFQNDLSSGPTLQPAFVHSLDRAACDTAGDTSWPIGGWHLDVEAAPSTGHGSSRLLPSTSDKISTNSGFINCCVQQAHTDQTTAPVDLHLTSVAGHTTYPSSPPFVGWSPGAWEVDRQSCSNSISDTSESPRHATDEFLVQSKQSGMSYREIRIKGHFKEAESTLRGRYRTLTKCREHRVRKPQWHAKDVSLSVLRTVLATCAVLTISPDPAPPPSCG